MQNLSRTIWIAFAMLALTISQADARPKQSHRQQVEYEGRIVPHPPGCPWRLFCGCGVSVKIFGKPIRELFLARNWFKFPRTSPAPGMVAVRRHHVFALESHVSGNIWMVYDPNSGGHQTRIHTRDITGYVIVNPHSYASL